MAELPEPSFVDRDPAPILADCIAIFEAATDKPLLPTQVERLLIDLIVYRETLLRIAIQEAAKQNLPRYASYPMIDLLGDIVNALRLPAQPAITTMLVTLALTDVVPTVIASGARVRSLDGRATFTLDDDVTVPAGQLTASVGATCTSPGIVGNGYAPGQLAELVDGQPVAMTIVNTTLSNSGAPSETTPSLRSRFPDAVASTSTAGPTRAYRAHAKAAHPTILDVAVTNPTGGLVRLTVLTATGIPSIEILDLTEAACNDEWVRPLTDTVEAVACTEVNYTIECNLVLEEGANPEAVEIAATLASAAYAAERRAGLGRLPVLSKVFKALEVGGVFEVRPVALWTLPLSIAETEWANCAAITITVLGFEGDV